MQNNERMKEEGAGQKLQLTPRVRKEEFVFQIFHYQEFGGIAHGSGACVASTRPWV